MSIQDLVHELVEQGKLINRPSTFDGIEARSLYVVPGIDKITRLPFADTETGKRHAAIAQSFDAFCELNMITVAQDPMNKPADVMLARVAPVEREFWAMRIVEPEGTAGARVFGGFCAQDAFVALTCEFREDIADFEDEVSDVEKIWRDYFDGIPPHSGKNLNDYITNAIPGVF